MACGVCLVTRGYICCASHVVAISDTPKMGAMIEVRPVVRWSITEPVPAPAGEPDILSAVELRPSMKDSRGPTPVITGDKPKEISATELRPIIRGAKEEE